MIEKYVAAIYHKGQYNLAIDIVDKQQIIIDSEIQRLKADDLKDAWYHDIQFIKGMASYYLNDYNTATTIFKKLVQFDNHNDRFKNWLNSSRYGQNIWIVRSINVVCAVLLVSVIVFKAHIPNYYVRQSMLIGALLGMLANYAYESYIKRNQRKTNTN